MITLKRISYRNVLYLKHADLDLDREGVTFITGSNGDEEGRSNGAGKTLLVSGVSHLRHGSPIGSASLHKHSLFQENEASVEWSLSDGGSDWTFKKARQGKSIKWTGSRDGEPLLFRTSTQAEQAAASVFDFNDEEFYSTVYLDSRRPSPIMHGTGAARHSLVTELFRLEGYSKLRQWFLEKAKDARSKETLMSELASSVSGFDMDEESARKTAKAAEREAKRLRKETEKLKSDLRIRKDRDKLAKLSKTADKYDAKKLERAENAIEEHSEYEERMAEHRAWKWARNTLERMDAKLAETLEEAGEESAESLARTMERADETRVHMEEHLAKGGGTCGFCGAELTRKMARKKMAEADETIKRLSAKHAVVERIVETRPSWEKDEVSKPKKPKSDLDEAEKEAKAQRKREDAWKAAKELDKAGWSKEKGGSRDVAELEAELADLEKKLGKAEKNAAKKSALSAKAEAEAKTRKKALEKAEELAKDAADAALLETLAECYGPKGLRVLAVRAVAKALEENLNDHAPHLCPDGMKFSLSADAGSMSIEATRQDGRTSDVRHLSGAETRMFQLLWTAAVLPLLPSSRRCNVLVLDEFEAGVDAATRSLMSNEYLPRLARMVPHVLFISPYDVEPDEGRRILQVKRKGGRSIVEERTWR